jgi:hypothetical protein
VIYQPFLTVERPVHGVTLYKYRGKTLFTAVYLGYFALTDCNPHRYYSVSLSESLIDVIFGFKNGIWPVPVNTEKLFDMANGIVKTILTQDSSIDW